MQEVQEEQEVQEVQEEQEEQEEQEIIFCFSILLIAGKGAMNLLEKTFSLHILRVNTLSFKM